MIIEISNIKIFLGQVLTYFKSEAEPSVEIKILDPISTTVNEQIKAEGSASYMLKAPEKANFWFHKKPGIFIDFSEVLMGRHSVSFRGHDGASCKANFTEVSHENITVYVTELRNLREKETVNMVFLQLPLDQDDPSPTLLHPLELDNHWDNIRLDIDTFCDRFSLPTYRSPLRELALRMSTSQGPYQQIDWSIVEGTGIMRVTSTVSTLVGELPAGISSFRAQPLLIKSAVHNNTALPLNIEQTWVYVGDVSASTTTPATSSAFFTVLTKNLMISGGSEAVSFWTVLAKLSGHVQIFGEYVKKGKRVVSYANRDELAVDLQDLQTVWESSKSLSKGLVEVILSSGAV